MMGTKEIPNRADLVDFNYAVAGHAGTLSDPDGELFIKPCTQAEIQFYESANEKHIPFADLMPTFIGKLMLTDHGDMPSIEQAMPTLLAHAHEEHHHPHHNLVDGTTAPAIKVVAPEATAPVDNISWVPNKNRKIATNQAVVLDNATFGFKRPNIMDVKLGTRLWADDAPLEKKRRFDKIAAETTHRDLGFRIAGMRVYRGSPDEGELDDELYKIYDKDYGRFCVSSANVLDTFRRFMFNDAASIDEDLARAVAAVFLADLRHVRAVLEAEESRMYSSSLLFVFEGDGDALRAAIDEGNAMYEADVAARKDSAAATGGKNDRRSNRESPAGRSNHRVDSGICIEDEPPKIHTLKLIDFAHAEWTPGQGPDENVLKGVRSLIDIFERLCE